MSQNVFCWVFVCFRSEPIWNSLYKFGLEQCRSASCSFPIVIYPRDLRHYTSVSIVKFLRPFRLFSGNNETVVFDRCEWLGNHKLKSKWRREIRPYSNVNYCSILIISNFNIHLISGSKTKKYFAPWKLIFQWINVSGTPQKWWRYNELEFPVTFWRVQKQTCFSLLLH